MPPWDSNPQSQQASGRRHTPYTARPWRSSVITLHTRELFFNFSEAGCVECVLTCSVRDRPTAYLNSFPLTEILNITAIRVAVRWYAVQCYVSSAVTADSVTFRKPAFIDGADYVCYLFVPMYCSHCLSSYQTRGKVKKQCANPVMRTCQHLDGQSSILELNYG
jgi:hypothetical protein